MEKKKYGDYYLGLDMGTSSVGWAVTDLNYNVLKFNGKGMWGVRLFDEANTAEDRRMFRIGRRRNQRESQRIKLLQELFAEEIAKKDFAFFMRLKESQYYVEDRSDENMQPNTLFCDPNYNDSDYHKAYPTIYHLRRELIQNNEPHDVRLVYLALHHILKHRGHFLFGNEFSDVSEYEIEPLLNQFIVAMEEIMSVRIEILDSQSFGKVMVDQESNITSRKVKIAPLIDYDKNDQRDDGLKPEKMMKAMITLLAGGKAKLSEIFGDEGLSDNEQNGISFAGDSFDENEAVYRSLLEDKFSIIEQLKGIYDWGVLQYILDGEKYISFAKVKLYSEHEEDLKQLKSAVKEYRSDKYKEVFRSQAGKLCNYSAYIGNYRNKGKHTVVESRCTQEQFCDYLRKDIFKNVEINEDKYPGLAEKIETGTLMPKQRIKNNGVIPYQVHKNEMDAILKNAACYLDFLNAKDDNGISVKEKIALIMTYRIPYYVGPVNTTHNDKNGGFAWAVKKSQEPVRPWNFEKVIDLETSAENFIRKMTNKCTYLVGEDVVPKDSILYSKFMVLNELNNLRIDEEKISVELKQQIYQKLFLKKRRVTTKDLSSFLKREGFGEGLKLSGFDINFKSSMASYLDFVDIFGKENLSDAEMDMAETIIKYITLFGEDKKILVRKIKSQYGDVLTDEMITKIKKKKYTGWGRLSEKFLTGITEVDSTTGEYGEHSILYALFNYDGNPNLMELLSNNYGFSNAIEIENAGKNGKLKQIQYKDLDDLYVSAPVKRSIWQTVTIVKELVKITGHEPKKIFIEMTRGPVDNQKKRTISRKNKLLELYANCRKEEPVLYASLEAREENTLRGDKLYLYYTQMGRCMYSGEVIDLDRLQQDYDVDHIFPQSVVMDDSIENRVLVKRELNAKKSDAYPIPSEWQSNMKRFWTMLHNKGMIGKTKYARLIRKEEFTDGELTGFVSRQIVETGQSTKAVAQLFKRIYENTEIIYVKGGNVSAFRRGVDDMDTSVKKHEYDKNGRMSANEFIKVRAINDYHHAKDAYLNIVVGNVFHSKFTANPANFFKQKDHRYSMNAMYKFPVARGSVDAWVPSTLQSEGTMATVKRMMRKNNIQFTRYAKETKGGLFDQMIMKKGSGQVSIKAEGPLSDISKYGGYNKAAGAYFFLVEHEKKGKRVRSIEYVPVYLCNKIQINGLEEYARSELNLSEPKILISKIKYDTLFEISGFRCHLSSRSGDRLFFKNANQLFLGKELTDYCKKLINFEQKRVKERDAKISSFDKITKQGNIEMYDALAFKTKEWPFNVKYERIGEIMQDNKLQFQELPLEEQTTILLGILPLFQCNVIAANLKLIGGGEKSGIITLGKDITNAKDIFIINQSPTGLFELKINLLKL